MWDAVGAIAGVVSAICSVVSIRYLATPHARAPVDGKARRVITPEALFSFLLACSEWCLVVLSYLWIFKPYGPYIRRDEYVQIVGVIVALPALIIFMSGMRYIARTKG